MSQEKAEKESAKEILSSVKEEMDKPRETESVRKQHSAAPPELHKP